MCVHSQLTFYKGSRSTVVSFLLSGSRDMSSAGGLLSVTECRRITEDSKFQNDPNARLKFFEGLCSALKPQDWHVKNAKTILTPRTTASTAKAVEQRSRRSWFPILVIGVLDVWSQIRKLCARSLGEYLLLEPRAAPSASIASLLQECNLFSIAEKPNSGWYQLEGVLLLVKAFYGVVSCGPERRGSIGSSVDGDGSSSGISSPLSKPCGATFIHALLTKILLPLSFHVQVPVRNLAHELVAQLANHTIPAATSGSEGEIGFDVWIETEELKRSYRALVTSAAKQRIEQGIPVSNPQNDAAVEGGISLYGVLETPLPTSLIMALAKHPAASIRHATAQLLSEGECIEEEDSLATLVSLCERVLSAFRTEGDGMAAQLPDLPWEPMETHLMALHLHMMKLLHMTCEGPSLPIVLSLQTLDAIAKCLLEVKRFDVRRIAQQLLPLMAQYITRCCDKGDLTPLLHWAEALEQGSEVQVVVTNTALLFAMLHVASIPQAYGSPADIRIRTFQRVLGNMLAPAKLATLPPYSVALLLTHLRTFEEPPSDKGIEILVSHWKACLPASAVSLRSRLSQTAPDFAARYPELVLEKLMNVWANMIVAHSSESHVQCLLLDGLIMTLKGRRNHRRWGSAVHAAMKAPTFEDDPDGIGAGLYYIKCNLANFQVHPAPPAHISEKFLVGGNGESDPALTLLLKELLTGTVPLPSTELNVVARLYQLAVAAVYRGLLQATDVFDICVRQRLNRTCGVGWRTHSPASLQKKTTSANDWDDSSEDEEDDGNGAVEGVSFASEIAGARKLIMALGWWEEDEDATATALSLASNTNITLSTSISLATSSVPRCLPEGPEDEEDKVDVSQIINLCKTHVDSECSA